MLKIATLCILIAFTSAAVPSWLGHWYVLSSVGSDICNMPSNVTDPLISTYMGTLALYGNTANGVPGRWDFVGWTDPNAQTQASCSGSQCVTGYLTTPNGITYANITWNSTTGPEVYCSILLSPANASWIGSWFVLSAGTNSLPECDVPKQAGMATLINQTYGVQMNAVDQKDGTNTVWELPWGPNQITSNNVTLGKYGVSAELSIVAGVLHGEITWNVTGASYYCKVQMYRLPTEEEIDYERVMVFGDSKFLDFIA